MQKNTSVIEITKGTTVWSRNEVNDECQRIFPLRVAKN